ncbi:hypothetical protein NL676_033608 [Syzygium grande]|nr:hypothetical protein NL676_033608 [Syzygium grande]
MIALAIGIAEWPMAGDQQRWTGSNGQRRGKGVATDGTGSAVTRLGVELTRAMPIVVGIRRETASASEENRWRRWNLLVSKSGMPRC